MSQWIVLMVPQTLDRKGLAKALLERPARSVVIVPETETESILVRWEDSGDIVHIDELAPRLEVVADYAADALLLPSFRSLLPELRFFKVRYGEWRAARLFLKQVLEGWQEDITKLWIDDDYDGIWNGGELRDRLLADPTWDWREKKIWYVTLICKERIAFSELAEWIAARDRKRTEIDTEHEEIRVSALPGRRDAGRSAVALYSFATDPASPDDPILLEMLKETFGPVAPGSSCFILRYGDHGLAKQVLETCLKGLGARSRHVQIDFEDGTTLTGDETLEWLRLEPDWDWR